MIFIVMMYDDSTKKERLKNEIAMVAPPQQRKTFERDVLQRAVEDSSSIELEEKYPGAASLFREIKNVLDASEVDSSTGSMTVRLACNIQQTTGDVIEAALRKALGDDKDAEGRPHNVDVIFRGTPIEVKYARIKFSKLATDSQSLRRRNDKWYIYVSGDISLNKSCDYNVWLMRSDALYDAVRAYRDVDDTAIDTSIDISTERRKRITSLAQIRADIRKIETDLRNAIWNKATGDDLPVRSMGLERRVGLNRVRFDLKFETTLRDTIREILRS